MQWQERFRRARAEWMLLTFYERFEQVVDSDPHWPHCPRRRLRRVEPRAQDLPCRPCSLAQVIESWTAAEG